MSEEPTSVDLLGLLASATGPGPVWSRSSDDLNVNLLHFEAGQGVPNHRNDEVDVLIVGIAGEGILEIAGVPRPLRAGTACIVPKGVMRSIRCERGSCAYLSCHRRRAGLWPS
jgi:quercetin dioxygenase-like cupin family protein